MSCATLLTTLDSLSSQHFPASTLSSESQMQVLKSKLARDDSSLNRVVAKSVQCAPFG